MRRSIDAHESKLHGMWQDVVAANEFWPPCLASSINRTFHSVAPPCFSRMGTRFNRRAPLNGRRSKESNGPRANPALTSSRHLDHVNESASGSAAARTPRKIFWLCSAMTPGSVTTGSGGRDMRCVIVGEWRAHPSIGRPEHKSIRRFGSRRPRTKSNSRMNARFLGARTGRTHLWHRARMVSFSAVVATANSDRTSNVASRWDSNESPIACWIDIARAMWGAGSKGRATGCVALRVMAKCESGPMPSGRRVGNARPRGCTPEWT